MGDIPKTATIETHGGESRVIIPQGWYRVGVLETCNEGDQFYHLGKLCFMPVEKDDLGAPADTFNLLIRRVQP